MKPNIIHFHSDPKFVSEIENYSKDYFSNKLIFTGNYEDLNEKYKIRAINLSKHKKDRFKEVIQICEDADFVILNNLDSFNVNIVLGLPKEVIVIWRFFGHEVYSKASETVYSQKTLKFSKKPINTESFVRYLKYMAWKALNPGDRFKKALKRIDYFMGIMDDEYNFIKSLGYNLPPFLQLPFPPLWNHNILFNKEEQIIFGNSRNLVNNHLDIIEVFKNVDLSETLVIKMFFSYGNKGLYAKEVKARSKEIQNIEIIEDFLDKNEFQNLYTKSAALIINGYRQMAMANIFTAIMTGVKIYLSERNITYTWFQKHDIKVFSIENELEADLRNGNIYLKEIDALNNMKNVINFCKDNSVEKFNSRLIEIINEN